MRFKLLFVTSKCLAHTQVRSQDPQGTNDLIEIVSRQAEGLRRKNFHPQRVNSRSDYLYPNQHKYLPRLYSAVDIWVSFRFDLFSGPEHVLSSLLTKHSTSPSLQIILGFYMQTVEESDP